MPLANSASNQVGPRDSFRLKFFYGLGSVAYGVKDNGFSVLLLLFYNQALGLDARLAGLAIMIALIVDAILDPVIGYASDHLHSRWGRRHPFMYFAAIPVAASYLFLFSPPAGLGQEGLFLYLLGVAILVRTFIAIYEIPSSALVAELTQSYDQRTSYLSFRFFFGWVGGLTMGALAFAVFLKATSEFPSGPMNLDGYRAYGIAASLIMLFSILGSSVGTHSAIPWLARPAVVEERGTVGRGLRDVLAALSSRSAITILSASMLLALALGLTFALSPYFYAYYWGLSGGEVSLLVVSGFVSAFGALLVTPWLGKKFDKRGAALGLTVLVIFIMPLPLVLSLVGLFPEQGSPFLMPVLLLWSVIATSLPLTRGILIVAMLADVVEDNEVRTGIRAEGVFFAANTFVSKCVSGLGIFASSAILAIVGFPAQAVSGTVPAGSLERLAVAYVVSIVILNVIAMGCVRLYKITRSVHASNLAVIAERHTSAVAPEAGQGGSQI